MRIAIGGVVVGVWGGVLFAAPQEPPIVRAAPPAPTSQIVALEWRYADGSRLTYEGRDAVAAAAWLAGAEAMSQIHGGKAEQGLAGVRWTRTASDGSRTHGAWPGPFDPRTLLGLDPSAPPRTVGHPLDPALLARVFPGWSFQPLDIARTPAIAPAAPVLDHLVVAVPPALPAGAPETPSQPATLLDGLDDVLAFFRAHAKKPADASAAADQTTAFASLCRYDSWEGPLTSERDGGFVSALAVGLPGQRKQAGQLTLSWGASGLAVEQPRPTGVDIR